MPPRKISTAALSLLACWAGEVAAAKSVTLGATFPIAEPDVLTEIQTKASANDWRQWMRKTPTAEHSAFKGESLPRASKNESRLFDPTYTLPMDIKDENGKVLYPKGYRINVYTRIKMPGRIIVIGPAEADFRWLDEIAKPGQGDKILLAGGNALLVRQQQKRNVFVLETPAIERFGLRAVPSIVQQEGLALRVTEYLVDGKAPKEKTP